MQGSILILLIVFLQGHICTECQEYGRFPDDEDCMKYVLCTKTSQGKNLTIRFTCFEGSAFNPDISRCEDGFGCSKPECLTVGERFPDASIKDGSSYYMCIELNDGYLPLKLTCPEGSKFDVELKNCKYLPETFQSETIPNELTTTISTTIATTTTTPPFVCTSVGRYPDPLLANCKGYVMCVYLSTDQFAQYHYTCPNTSKFNPIIKQCSYNYNCLDVTTTQQTVETTTLQQEQWCTSSGRFPDPSLSDCSGYVICELLSNNTFKQTNFKCRPKASYNPIVGQCSFTYKCQTSPTKTKSSSYYIIKNNCTSSGRYKDETSSDCSGYVLCANDESYKYTCPYMTKFDPVLKRCSTSYNCNVENKWFNNM